MEAEAQPEPVNRRQSSSPGSKHWQMLGSCVAAANCRSPGHTAAGPAGPVILIRTGAQVSSHNRARQSQLGKG